MYLIFFNYMCIKFMDIDIINFVIGLDEELVFVNVIVKDFKDLNYIFCK